MCLNSDQESTTWCPRAMSRFTTPTSELVLRSLTGTFFASLWTHLAWKELLDPTQLSAHLFLTFLPVSKSMSAEVRTRRNTISQTRFFPHLSLKHADEICCSGYPHFSDVYHLSLSQNRTYSDTNIQLTTLAKNIGRTL